MTVIRHSSTYIVLTFTINGRIFVLTFTNNSQTFVLTFTNNSQTFVLTFTNNDQTLVNFVQTSCNLCRLTAKVFGKCQTVASCVGWPTTVRLTAWGNYTLKYANGMCTDHQKRWILAARYTLKQCVFAPLVYD